MENKIIPVEGPNVKKPPSPGTTHVPREGGCWALDRGVKYMRRRGRDGPPCGREEKIRGTPERRVAAFSRPLAAQI